MKNVTLKQLQNIRTFFEFNHKFTGEAMNIVVCVFIGAKENAMIAIGTLLMYLGEEEIGTSLCEKYRAIIHSKVA